MDEFHVDSTTLPTFLVLGTLSNLINQSIFLVEGADEQLANVSGLVVRLRLEKPSLVIYCLLHNDGVEFLSHYEGTVDVRVRASVGALLQYLLLPNEEHADSIRLQGSSAHLGALQELVDFCSFWSVARSWLDRYVRFNDLLQLLNREDPAWLNQLQGLPREIRQQAQHLAEQQLLQEDVVSEINHLRCQRRYDQVAFLCGFVLMLVAFMTFNGQLGTYFPHQAVTAASLAVLVPLVRFIVSLR